MDSGTSIIPVDLEIFQAMFMFEKKVSVKNAVYTPIKGRTFLDYWNTRKNPALVMESPVDILEHFERLQNWSDYSLVPFNADRHNYGNSWGKGYATGARVQIGATGRGSFDDVTDGRLVNIKALKCAGQVHNYNDCYSDKLKKSVCRDFFLASWFNSEGYAQVAPFNKVVPGETKPAITEIVTLANVTDRTKIKIDFPDVADMYPEPFVNFNLNNATGEYEGRIAVTNADQAIYQAGYVEGVEGAIAQLIWEECHKIWIKCGHLEPPPKDMTDKTWFNGVDSQAIAENYLLKWVYWMGLPTIHFPVHYNKAAGYEEAKEIVVNFPHQTGGVNTEAVVSKLVFSPNPPYETMISAVLLDEDLPDDFGIKDTWVNQGGGDDWKDSRALQGGSGDVEDTYI